MSEANAKYSAEGDVSFEILEMPKKGFLGIGGTPAKVKVIVDDGEDDIDISSIIGEMKALKVETDRGSDGSDASAPAVPAERPVAPVNKKTVKPAASANNTPAKITTPANKPAKATAPAAPAAPATEKPAKPAAPVNAEPAVAPVKESAPEVVPAVTTAVVDEDKKKKYEPVSDVEMQFAVEFIEAVIRDLDIEAVAVPVKDEDGDFVGINIEGEGTGALIGHHGETLDAIQYLANLSASRRSPTPNREFLKLTVDVENYRAKREETLRALARRMAAKAVKYKRNFVLEPMNPYERRIIHSEIQNIDDVDTHSVGSDENRKVVVTYEGSDKAYRGSRSRRRRGNGDPRPAATMVSPSTYIPVGNHDDESEPE